jgi:hypothetical protein
MPGSAKNMRGKLLVPDFVLLICLGSILAMFCISNAAVQHVNKNHPCAIAYSAKDS